MSDYFRPKFPRRFIPSRSPDIDGTYFIYTGKDSFKVSKTAKREVEGLTEAYNVVLGVYNYPRKYIPDLYQMEIQVKFEVLEHLELETGVTSFWVDSLFVAKSKYRRNKQTALVEAMDKMIEMWEKIKKSKTARIKGVYVVEHGIHQN